MLELLLVQHLANTVFILRPRLKGFEAVLHRLACCDSLRLVLLQLHDLLQSGRRGEFDRLQVPASPTRWVVSQIDVEVGAGCTRSGGR